MKKIILPLIILFLFTAGLTSCNNYGKKVEIEGTKAEVFYKGGVTEAEAKKTGNFLKETGFIGNEKEASVQLVKENGGYTVRFVYNKDYYDKTPGLEDFFKTYGARISKDIFDGKKVNIALADKQFKDYKTIPYYKDAVNDEDAAKNEKDTNGSFNKSDFDHDTRGDVTFYWKGVSDKESKAIADYVVETGAFSGGTSEIYITKESGRYLLKFPVKEGYRNDESTIAQIEKVSKQIKENVFPNDPYSFQITDERLHATKSFDY
jgi:hypothetical protein